MNVQCDVTLRLLEVTSSYILCMCIEHLTFPSSSVYDTHIDILEDCLVTTSVFLGIPAW